MTAIPTKESNRIEILDIWRGFAILGIFMVNILVMNCAFTNRPAYEQEWAGILDQGSLRFFETFFYSKFYPIFSFLFGLGVALQVQKQLDSNRFSWAFFVRRFGFLLVFGLAHLLFIWSGDILHLYAFFGLPLILAVRSSKIIIGILATFVFFFPYWIDAVSWLLAHIDLDNGIALEAYNRADLIEIYRTGTYIDIFEIRIKEYAYASSLLYGYIAPISFVMMLMGVLLAKSNILQNIPAFIQQHKAKFLIFALLSFAYSAFISYYLLPTYGHDIHPIAAYILTQLFFLSDMYKALFFLFIIAWLYQSKTGKKLLQPLAFAGKMALSNYILQSIIGLILFTSLGFGLYEKLSPFYCFLSVIIIYSIQILISSLWFQQFKYGPLEWLWRSLTYKKVLSLK